VLPPATLYSYGVTSTEDLRIAVEDDLRHAGIADASERQKLLKAIRGLDDPGEL
jgi:hypothetical protein